MGYQDKWLHGRAIEKGYRECEARYEIVRTFCFRFNGPFTVCDIGANWCYFGIRLTEDFPLCSVMAFEFHAFQSRLEHLKRAKASRVLLLNHKFRIEDAPVVSACCHFDVVLALSVVHHMTGPFSERLTALRSLGDNLIIEFALDDSRRVAKQPGYQVPREAEVLGYGQSHLRPGIARPIVLLPGIKEDACQNGE